MENASEALTMAGSVLLFVIALSVVILAFSQVVPTMNAVLKHSDRESTTIENDPRFYYLAKADKTNRYVGKETIIPAIYRAYKENYKIIFDVKESKNPNYYIFIDRDENETNTIDLKKQSIANDTESRKFLNGIIYGDYAYETGKNPSEYDDHFDIKHNVSKTLFDFLTENEKDFKIREELGTYYEEDILKDGEPDEPSKVEKINKTEKRVITYVFERK